MYKFILLLLTCLNITIANAQIALGLEAGLALNKLHTILPDNSSKMTSDLGSLVSMSIDIMLSPQLYLTSGGQYVNKNYTLDRSGQFSGLYESFKNSYMQIPVALGYSTKSKLSFFIEAGGYAGYWLSSRTKGVIPNIYEAGCSSESTLSYYQGKVHFDSGNENRYEFGVTGSLGCAYPLATGLKLFFKTQYTQALTDQLKSNVAGRNLSANQTIYFTAGIIRSFSFQNHLYEK